MLTKLFKEFNKNEPFLSIVPRILSRFFLQVAKCSCWVMLIEKGGMEQASFPTTLDCASCSPDAQLARRCGASGSAGLSLSQSPQKTPQYPIPKLTSPAQPPYVPARTP